MTMKECIELGYLRALSRAEDRLLRHPLFDPGVRYEVKEIFRLLRTTAHTDSNRGT